MKKDFVISRIEASQDGSPYVFVTLTDPNDFKGGAERQQNPRQSWAKHDGIYVARGFDEEFTESNGKYF